MEKDNTFRWRLNNASIKFLLILSFNLTILDTYVNAQVDTTQLKLTVSQIESSEVITNFGKIYMKEIKFLEV